jgi:hypothetical protein
VVITESVPVLSSSLMCHSSFGKKHTHTCVRIQGVGASVLLAVSWRLAYPGLSRRSAPSWFLVSALKVGLLMINRYSVNQYACMQTVVLGSLTGTMLKGGGFRTWQEHLLLLAWPPKAAAAVFTCS